MTTQMQFYYILNFIHKNHLVLVLDKYNPKSFQKIVNFEGLGYSLLFEIYLSQQTLEEYMEYGTWRPGFEPMNFCFYLNYKKNLHFVQAMFLTVLQYYVESH